MRRDKGKLVDGVNRRRTMSNYTECAGCVAVASRRELNGIYGDVNSGLGVTVDSGMAGLVPEGVAGNLSPQDGKGTDEEINRFGRSLPSRLLCKRERHVALDPLRPACEISGHQLW
jgi:hypothetical protein